MLALFDQAAKDGIVTANEIHDFKALENPDWTAGGATPKQKAIFTMPDSVRGAESDVVDGDPANATYQGTLSATWRPGPAPSQLQKLVDKWFLGLDRPTAGSGTTYKPVSGNLFVNGPAVTDVKQGNLSDCYFLAGLGELAINDRRAAITSNVHRQQRRHVHRAVLQQRHGEVCHRRPDVADGCRGKLVYDGLGATAGERQAELWVALAEKAYVQLNQSGWTEQDGTNRYAGIEDGYSDTVMMQVTGGNAIWYGIARVTSA